MKRLRVQNNAKAKSKVFFFLKPTSSSYTQTDATPLVHQIWCQEEDAEGQKACGVVVDKGLSW